MTISSWAILRTAIRNHDGTNYVHRNISDHWRGFSTSRTYCLIRHFFFIYLYL